MPGTSGFQVLAWIRKHAFPHLPVVVFTSSVHEEDRVHAQKLGATDYVVKPITYLEMQRFMATLEGFLGSFQQNNGLTGACSSS